MRTEILGQGIYGYLRISDCVILVCGCGIISSFSKRKRGDFFMRDDDELFEEGFWNGHDVWRDHEDGGIWFDGYYCADASDYEEAEMEYWNTH